MIHQNSFAVEKKRMAMRRVSSYLRISFFALLIVTSASFVAVNATSQAQTQSGPAKSSPKKKHRLRITKGYITVVSLKAEKAKMSEIARDLSKRLGTQVILGPTLSKQALTVEFYDLPLEPALRLLAPHVYIDYEIQANAQPATLAIFLMGQDDPEPAKSAVVQGSSEALLIEGNTEDSPEESEAEREDDPLQVDFEENHLTIKSKKQRLTAVLLTVAEELGVPAEIRYDSNEIVDTEIKDTPFEDAITRLSPNIRLYVRADLTRSQRAPLRLKLVPPPKATDSTISQ